jgi:hypothetical protein
MGSPNPEKELKYQLYWWIIAALIGGCIAFLTENLLLATFTSIYVWAIEPDLIPDRVWMDKS